MARTVPSTENSKEKGDFSLRALRFDLARPAGSEAPNSGEFVRVARCWAAYLMMPETSMR